MTSVFRLVSLHSKERSPYKSMLGPVTRLKPWETSVRRKTAFESRRIELSGLSLRWPSALRSCLLLTWLTGHPAPPFIAKAQLLRWLFPSFFFKTAYHLQWAIHRTVKQWLKHCCQLQIKQKLVFMNTFIPLIHMYRLILYQVSFVGRIIFT